MVTYVVTECRSVTNQKTYEFESKSLNVIKSK